MTRYLLGLMLVLTIGLVACNPDTTDDGLDTLPNDSAIEQPLTPATPATPPVDETPQTPLEEELNQPLDDAQEGLDNTLDNAQEGLDNAGDALEEPLDPLVPDTAPLPGTPAAPTTPQ